MLTNTQFFMPIQPFRQPFIIIFLIRSGFHKILHFHLFKFPHSEYKLPGNHLIAKSFSDLCDTKRNFLAGSIHHILKIHKNSLCRFRTQIHSVIIVSRRGRAKLSFKHQIKLTHIGPVKSPRFGCPDLIFYNQLVKIFAQTFARARRIQQFLKFIGFLLLTIFTKFCDMFFYQHICPIPFIGLFVINHRIVKPLHVSAGLPYFGMHKDRSIQPHNIVVVLSHHFPPVIPNIALQFGSQRTIIIDGPQATINF